MRRVYKQLFCGVLVLAALPLLAQTRESDQAVVLPLSSAPTLTDMAMVVTSKGRPADCLAPVAVTRIDGEKTVVSAKGFFIKPGVHTINGKATLDTTNCPLAGDNPQVNRAEDLEVDFKPGKTYYIGYYHKPANTLEWKLVVWHMEEGR